MLRDLVEQWLLPKTRMIHEVVDLIVLKQFLMDLGSNTQRWVWRHQPKTVEEDLQLAKVYAAAKGEGDTPRKERPGGSVMGPQQTGPSQERRGENAQNPGRESRAWDPRKIVCYRYKKQGHVSWMFP